MTPLTPAVGATKLYVCGFCGGVARSRPVPPPPALRLYGIPEQWALIFTPRGEPDFLACESCLTRPDGRPADRGRLINVCATLGMRLGELRRELPEVEKQARKTPRRDMHEERAKVEAAKARVEPLRTELAASEEAHAALHAELVRLRAYPETPSIGESHGVK